MAVMIALRDAAFYGNPDSRRAKAYHFVSDEKRCYRSACGTMLDPRSSLSLKAAYDSSRADFPIG